MLVRPGGLLGDTDVAAWLRRRWRRPPRSERPSAPAPAAAPGDLVAAGIVVRFGGFVALDGAGINVGPGEFVGLIGPNGAGKTTLFNVVTGLVAEQAGSVHVGDRDLSREPPHRIARAGLARTFQNLRLFPTLSVRENVELAALSARRYRRDVRAVDPDVLLADAGLADVAERPAATLDYGNQRRLELARAAALAPAYLLLDEPTSGMSDTESVAMVRARAGHGPARRRRRARHRPRPGVHHAHQRPRRRARRRTASSPRARPPRSAPTPPSPRPTSAATPRPDPSVCCERVFAAGRPRSKHSAGSKHSGQ